MPNRYSTAYVRPSISKFILLVPLLVNGTPAIIGIITAIKIARPSAGAIQPHLDETSIPAFRRLRVESDSKRFRHFEDRCQTRIPLRT